MNKALYQFCQTKFKTLRHGKLKLSALLRRLHNDHGFGVIEGNYLLFTEQDRAMLVDHVLTNTGLHLFRDAYPAAQSRQQTAKTQRNEKTNSYPVSRDFILLNSLQPLQLNQQQFPVSSLTSLGVYLHADEIKTVEHPQIILVENLAIMANLAALNIPTNLHSALWLYRGDINPEQQTSTAYQFFRRFKESDSHQLICFSDLDPAGIQIALTCGAQHWLTPEDSAVINISSLQGIEMEWSKQLKSVKWLDSRETLPQKCQTAFNEMLNTRKTLKQEQMLAHAIKLTLCEL